MTGKSKKKRDSKDSTSSNGGNAGNGRKEGNGVIGINGGNGGNGDGENDGEKKKGGKKKNDEGKPHGSDIFSDDAMENAYYVCHNVQDVLKSRGFPWPDGQKKKKKGKR